jgi:hypothetical protein
MAAGDIACPPRTSCLPDARATGRLIEQADPDAVLALGDEQYDDGTLEEFLGAYDEAWGGFKSITYPAPGNHEYNTPGAAGYYAYFGAAAGDPSQGWYSFDLGAWHIVSLNSECAWIGGCTLVSPQGRWLLADLAAHPAACTLAYWHRPRFSSGEYASDAGMAPFWEALYAAGAEIVLNGHQHAYERFAPQSPAAALDTQSGIREFVVGTGGAGLAPQERPQPNSEVRQSTTHGVLQLTLRPDGYDWSFVPIPGRSFTDSGSASCH